MTEKSRRLARGLLSGGASLAIVAACSQTPQSVRPTPDGGRLYRLHCSPCHENAPPDLFKDPPKLNGLFERETFPSGTPATDENARKVILQGKDTMPAFSGRLKEPEVQAIVTYLHTLTVHTNPS